MLEEIIAFKKQEIIKRKEMLPFPRLEASPFFRQKSRSLRDALSKPGPSVIGEFKRRSPSGGIFSISADPGRVAPAYEEAGVAAVSVLTDNNFFGGTGKDLENTVSNVTIPVLRKDFIIDEYQVYESKSLGASAVLLIAAVLTPRESYFLATLAEKLGMDVLFEIHDERDLEKLCPSINIIGVNNRDLKTLHVDTDRAAELLHLLPDNCLKVAESGFRTAEEVIGLHYQGYDAFLIGSRFMRSRDPGAAAMMFMNDIKKRMS